MLQVWQVVLLFSLLFPDFKLLVKSITKAPHAGANARLWGAWQRIKCLSWKRGISLEKMHFKLSLLIVWIALWIVNTYSKLRVNIFSNSKDIRKCHCFCTMTTDKDDAKAIVITRVFSENSRAKNDCYDDNRFLYLQYIFICMGYNLYSKDLHFYYATELNSLPHKLFTTQSQLLTTL